MERWQGVARRRAGAWGAQLLNDTHRVALLMHGNLRVGPGSAGKMGHGLLRWRIGPIAAVIDRDHAGRDSAEITGIPRSVPVVASVAEAKALGADVLIPAIAPPGGVLPEDWRAEIVDALRCGMSIVNGLHASFAEDPEFEASRTPGAFLQDLRREPPGLANGTGAARTLAARRILTVGTDMAIGKMTVSLACHHAALERELRSTFLATGQIGIAIAGRGIALDAVRVDFASGAVERETLEQGRDVDLVWVEGQGSVLHPASTAWLPLLRGAMPTDLILCHRAGQTSLARAPWVEIPPLAQVAGLYETVAAACGVFPEARVRAVALDTSRLEHGAAERALEDAARVTGLPVVDVVREGAGRLLDAVIAPHMVSHP